jgi:hypothetical protein
MKKYLVFIFVIVIAGCSSSQQKDVSPGYHYSKKINSKVEKITFRGNGLIKFSDAKKYALLRSAEYAAENKKEYFLIYSSLNEIALNIPTTEAVYSLFGGIHSAFVYVVLIDEKQKGALNVSEVFAQLEADGVKREL